jgi:hypothetical protein
MTKTNTWNNSIVAKRVQVTLAAAVRAAATSTS